MEPVGNHWQMHEQQKWISWNNKATAVKGTVVEVVVELVPEISVKVVQAKAKGTVEKETFGHGTTRL